MPANPPAQYTFFTPQGFLQTLLGRAEIANARQSTAVLALITSILGFLAALITLLFSWNIFPWPVKTVACISLLLFGVVLPLYRWGAPHSAKLTTIANHCIPAALFLACGFAAVYMGGYAPLAATYAAAIPLLSVMICGTRGAIVWSGAMLLALIAGILFGPLAPNPQPVAPWFGLAGGMVMLVPTLISMLMHRSIWANAVRREKFAQMQLTQQFQREQTLARKLADSDRAQGLTLMAGRIAHDLNNFLVSVGGNAEFAKLRLQQGDFAGVDESMRAIEIAAADAGELARQLLNYSGDRPVTMERVILNERVAEAVALAQAVVAPGTLIETELPDDMLRVDGDPTQLNQVMINLLRNAAQAYDALPNPQEPRVVHIGLSDRTLFKEAASVSGREIKPGAYACISVTDEGCGFPEGQIERAFEPFVSNFADGTGLGLSSVAGIVDAHGGGIVVESKIGQGSCVYVYLPKASSKVVDLPDSSAKQAAPRRRALVVDDQAAVRQVVGSLLEQLDFEPLYACDGAEGLNRWVAERPAVSVLIVDVSMPELSGTEMLESVRAKDPHVPVVLISGYAGAANVAAFTEDPNTEFLQKPFSARALSDTLQQLSA